MFLEHLTQPRAEALAVADTGGSYGVFGTMLNMFASASGTPVTPSSAMRSSAVFACVKVLSETVAQLPLHVYKRRPDGSKELALDHPLSAVLAGQPNLWQTSFEWRETMQAHLCLRGNAYSRIIPGKRGAASELIPWHPDLVGIERLTNGRLRYQYPRYRIADESPGYYSQDEVFHLRNTSLDGIFGLSPIECAKNAIGLALDSEKYGARFFMNSARPDGMITTDQVLKADAAEENRQRWIKAHGGVDNSHGTAVMTNGLKWQTVGMTNTDAQFLELRKFQITEIARVFRIPPHMIADLTASTNNNIEHQGADFVRYCMMPWLRRWEEAIQRDLIGDEKYYCKFEVGGLLRGDSAARAALYSSGINTGWLMPNEARELEDLPPVEGGDSLWVQGAMVPMDQKLNPPEVTPEPAPAPAEPELAQLPAPEPNNAYSEDVIGKAKAVAADIAGRLLRVECSCLRRFAKKPSGFMAAVDDFYTNVHGPRLLKALEPSAQLIAVLKNVEAESVSSRVDAYIKDHREQVFEAAGQATPDTLMALVGDCIRKWSEQCQ